MCFDISYKYILLEEVREQRRLLTIAVQKADGMLKNNKIKKVKQTFTKNINNTNCNTEE